MVQKTHTFHIHGMHCAVCVVVTESELLELSHIKYAKSNLHNNSVEVSGEFGDRTPEVIAEELTLVLTKHGYRLSVEREVKNKKLSDFKIAVPVALTFAVLFVVLQKIGLVNLVDTSQVSYGTAIVVGIIASLSTCMAVVGGLLLSMSASFAKEGDKIRPQLLFHIGRIISFFILGGIIGAIGSAFTLNTGATFILNLIIGLVMLVLGLNLLDVFHFTKKFQPAMPKFLARHAFGLSKLNHSVTPFLVGVATFFLPCGFTQSMQIFTLSTGSFLKGGLTMLAFALGTLPVLALVSFSSFSIKNNSKAGIFFKTAGLVVIMFALFNLINSLVVIGVLPPVFNF
jgi:sulfite exporter TauE/SafE/copper chaperone CopZ